MPQDDVAACDLEDLRKCDSISRNIHLIDIDVLSDVERDLEDYELVSLVFLLYDETNTALERLTLLNYSSESSRVTSLSLLHDWALRARSKQFWRYELLEALTICQLFSNIRKLGFDVEDVKSHFLPNNLNTTVYIHPIKKVLYKFCEDLSSIKFEAFISLLDVNPNLANGLPYEIYIMTLINKKYISLGYWNPLVTSKIQVGTPICKVEKLFNIINELDMKEFYSSLVETEARINEAIILETTDHKSKGHILKLHQSAHVPDEKSAKTVIDCKKMNKLFENLLNQDVISKNIAETTKSENSGCYEIFNTMSLGVCYIINQRNFCQSHQCDKGTKLEDRTGTDVDCDELVKTWTYLGFRTIVHENVKSSVFLNKIHDIIQNKVKEDDSAFVVCILSHGLKGVIFSSDSLPVAILDIEKQLYADKLKGKPKIMLIQACQNNGNEKKDTMRKDGPEVFHTTTAPPKSDIVVFSATIPEHTAMRDEVKGTWFIQTLCTHLKKYSAEHHLLDIFTKVTGTITQLRYWSEAQVPCHTSSLRKFFYFCNFTSKVNIGVEEKNTLKQLKV